MGEQDRNDYRLDALEARADKTDEKLDAILEKIDLLRSEMSNHRCPQPGLCVVLKVQIDNITATLSRLNARLDQVETDHAAKIAGLEKDVRSLDLWKNWILGGLALLTGLLGYFSNEIKQLLLH